MVSVLGVALFALKEQQDIRQRAATDNGPKVSTQSPAIPVQVTSTPMPLPESSLTPTPEQDQYTAPNDTVQPTVTAISLDNDAQVQANTLLELSATASDDIGVGNVEFLVNGTLICSSASPFTCNWTVPADAGMQYEITVRAYDLTGNVSSKSIVVTAD